MHESTTFTLCKIIHYNYKLYSKALKLICIPKKVKSTTHIKTWKLSIILPLNSEIIYSKKFVEKNQKL